MDTLSDFKDASSWDNLSDSDDTAISNPTIILYKYLLFCNSCLDLEDIIIHDTISIVSDGILILNCK